MRYALNSVQMREVDEYTINSIGIDGLILMERAALCIADYITEHFEGKEILVICGGGNNGGDGVAAARILNDRGFDVNIFIPECINTFSKQMEVQMSVAGFLNLDIIREFPRERPEVIVDAIFGTGLKREITGAFNEITDYINYAKNEGTFVISADIPSGISCDNGKVLGTAVRADVTCTFGELKAGLMVYPGKKYAGKVIVCDIGFPKKALSVVVNRHSDSREGVYKCLDREDIKLWLPERRADFHKGNCGKVLIFAGSERMCGAAVLCAGGAVRSGAGLVRVISSEDTITAVNMHYPEALTSCCDDEEFEEKLEGYIDWADAVVAGPGIGTSSQTKELLLRIIRLVKNKNKKMVLDADALNIISEVLDNEQNADVWNIRSRFEALESILPENTIVTPHKKELARLAGGVIADSLIDITAEIAYNSKIAYVLKDAATVTAMGHERYINTSGNAGMATAGSGDVLSGIIAALLAMGLDKIRAAALGVYIHGLAGDVAVDNKGIYSMSARDIADGITGVLKNQKG